MHSTDPSLQFLSTPEFGGGHPRIHFFPPTGNEVEVREFINSCDAMVYGRKNLETFGLAPAEFSYCNKPIILHKTEHTNGFHMKVLKRTLQYATFPELTTLLLNFDRKAMQAENWYFYAQFSPREVMKTFYTLMVAPYLRR